MYALLVLTLCFLCGYPAVLAQKSKQCGSTICGNNEYCQTYETRCEPCSRICDKNHHNYEEVLCKQNCQEYLQDIGFGGDINKLYKLVSLTLTLVCLVILVLLLIAGYKIYQWSRKNDFKDIWKSFKKERGDSENKSQPNNGVVIQNGKQDLRLEMPSQGVQSDIGSPVTMTTSIATRRPAEDSALDYAYDNHGMSGTPSPHSAKTTRESNF